MKILNKIIWKIINSDLFIRNIDYKVISQKINQITLQQNQKWITLGKNSCMYPESSISNFQFDKGKIEIGRNSHIRGELLVFASGGNIKIGDNCFVGNNCHIWSGELVEIGNNVLISHNVNIVDSNSHEINSIERAEGFIKLIQHGFPKGKRKYNNCQNCN